MTCQAFSLLFFFSGFFWFWPLSAVGFSRRTHPPSQLLALRQRAGSLKQFFRPFYFPSFSDVFQQQQWKPAFLFGLELLLAHRSRCVFHGRVVFFVKGHCANSSHTKRFSARSATGSFSPSKAFHFPFSFCFPSPPTTNFHASQSVLVFPSPSAVPRLHPVLIPPVIPLFFFFSVSPLIFFVPRLANPGDHNAGTRSFTMPSSGQFVRFSWTPSPFSPFLFETFPVVPFPIDDQPLLPPNGHLLSGKSGF